MRAAALEDRTDLPKGKNPQKQEECYQLLKSWSLASHLKHTPRDSPSFILYCLLVEVDLRGEDYGLWSQKDMGWHHSKLLKFLEPQVNFSSVKWVNYSCSVMSQVVVSNALENAHKSAWHSSWHTVSAHSRQLYHFPCLPSLRPVLPSLPPILLTFFLPSLLPSIHPSPLPSFFPRPQLI